MSCVCVLTPVVIASWPALSAAVTAAATSLGYIVAKESLREEVAVEEENQQKNSIELEMPKSTVVGESLGRGQKISVSRDGVTIVFSRDARGKAALCVSGDNYTNEELMAIGETMSQRVTQQYVFQKLQAEVGRQGFEIIEQEQSEDNSIRLKVRQWS